MTVVHADTSAFVYRFGRISYDLRSRSFVMGVLNVTPDSFSDGGKFQTTDAAVERAAVMAEEGADFIDVGGESSRPGSEPVPLDVELERVLPVVREISRSLHVPVSVDTMKAPVADEALKAGACIVNDISGLTFDQRMAETIARHGATAVIMHMKGKPATMQQNPRYDDVVGEVKQFLQQQAAVARKAGIRQIILDPGLGFGKTLEHNLTLLRNLGDFVSLGYPLLAGPSRKSFIGSILDLPVEQRLEGTAAAVTACLLRGVSIVRVHDVREMKRVARMADALRAR